MSKKNGPDTATAPAAKRTRRKTTVILQKYVDAHKGGDTDRVDHWEDWVQCTGVRDARKRRKGSGEQGNFRIIEVLDEFNVGLEQMPREVITRGGQ